MTPDSTPIVGGTQVSNLYLSTGHGTLGWTMAAGTGRVMADLISGRNPEISLAGLTVDRYWRGNFNVGDRRESMGSAGRPPAVESGGQH